MIGAIISIISVFHFRWLAMRFLSMIWAGLWLFYNIKEGSLWWVITILILTTANIITMIRIIISNKKLPKEELELEPELIK